MSLPLEEYALLSNTRTAALVSRGGSIDWLCLPRFDSPACFAALLGDIEHGRWLIGPAASDATTQRRYREGTLILETEHRTSEGVVRVIDAMSTDDHRILRLVEGREGRVPMRMELRLRFDYGSVVPWVRNLDGELSAIAGPDGIRLRTPVPKKGVDFRTIAEFSVAKGDSVPFELTWHESHLDPPTPVKVPKAIRDAEKWWSSWSKRCAPPGEWSDEVRDSLVVLRGLSHSPTGSNVAAATTSLPEHVGGSRNWDYRYCWIRDATWTLIALLEMGYEDEALAWRDWLLRALAGGPEGLQIVYSVAGERRLPETEIPWLPGYEASSPIRVGNDAATQFQLDVFGEALDALYHTRDQSGKSDPDAWSMQKVLLDFLEGRWREPDQGLWEVRGEPRQFVYSKVMAWVAFDRAVRTLEQSDLDGDLERWKSQRSEIHREVCERGVDERGVFTQSYGSKALDGSALMIPLVGFLPPDDPRVAATVAAVERELCEDGLVKRYIYDPELDGIDCPEGAFLLCTFWLADNYAILGRREEALLLFERLLALRNDVGLLSEQYDPRSARMLGNFPQAISHVALVITAATLNEEKRGGSRTRAGHELW